jgi:hypothetical protein
MAGLWPCFFFYSRPNDTADSDYIGLSYFYNTLNYFILLLFSNGVIKPSIVTHRSA